MFQLLFLFSTVLVAASAAPKADVDVRLRVVGGKDAEVGEFPYMASLRNEDWHICGGSILNSRTILTAAEPLMKFTPDNVTVVVGSIYLNSGGTKYKVSKIIKHPDFNLNTGDNDIAVLITSEAITTSSNVGFISLPSSNTGAGVKVTLTGWGSTSLLGKLSNTLQKITLLTISIEECKSKLSDNNIKQDINICTLTKAGEGPCYGDTADPIVEGNAVVGIFSRGIPCALGYPDVYTRVSYFVPWINENTQS